MALRITDSEYMTLQARTGKGHSVITSQPEAKQNKYRNKPVVIDGIRFASKAEGARYCELKLMERADQIAGLKRQVRYQLVVNGVHICDYLADFAYYKDCKRIIEDVKGVPTPEYKLKKKLTYALFGIEIIEITRARRKRK